MGDVYCNKPIDSSITGKLSNVFVKDVVNQIQNGGLSSQENEQTGPRKNLPQAFSQVRASRLSTEKGNLRTDSDVSVGLPGDRFERRAEESRLGSEYAKDEFQDEPLDPRIKYLIVNLSDSATTVNSLQTELQLFQQRSEEYIYSLGSHLEALIDDVGNSILQAVPYYDAVDRLRLAEIKLQQASFSFARATTKLQSSKEKIAKLEENLIQHGTEDVAILTCLNTVTNSYAECHQEKVRVEKEQENALKEHGRRFKEVNALYDKKKRAVEESKPFFVLRHQIETVIKDDTEHVAEVTAAIQQAKQQHSNAAEELQKISTEIHQKRQENLRQKQS
ncbi:hypothetical protein RvY_16528 [Ramazzottius varieornatus]|uniref:Uncharacterized protein n=1 Tax=Ramazzottius varieornatus TaxID=947166 RepID=A0A1D1VYS6_RAMVA|nr:hypothetical protein RvY_16528 [Ramazzottius varieornatus]